jgi:hypothetical protein
MTTPTTSTTKSKISIQSRDTTLIAGIKKRFSAATTILAAAVTYTPLALVALFQSQIDALNKVLSTRAQWKATVLSARALTLTVNQVYSALQTILRAQYANAPDALSDFGMVPKKVTKRSPVKNVVAAARNLSTRKARNTLGSKAKLAIQGTVTGSQIESEVAAAMGPTQPAAANGGQPQPPPPASATPAVAASEHATPTPGAANGTPTP